MWIVYGYEKISNLKTKRKGTWSCAFPSHSNLWYVLSFDFPRLESQSAWLHDEKAFPWSGPFDCKTRVMYIKTKSILWFKKFHKVNHAKLAIECTFLIKKSCKVANINFTLIAVQNKYSRKDEIDFQFHDPFPVQILHHSPKLL